MAVGNHVYVPNQWQTANPAIVIQSSDVDVDLCGHSINGSGNLTAPFSPSPSVPGGIEIDVRVDATIGILVNPDFQDISNVSVHNGAISYNMVGFLHFFVTNIRFYDLRIEKNGSITALQNIPPFEFYPNATQGIGSTNVFYERLQCTDCRSTVLPQNSSKNVVYRDIQISRSRGNSQSFGPDDSWLADPEWVEYGSFVAGIIMFNAKNVVLERITMYDTTSLLAAFGFYIDSGSDCRIEDCYVEQVEQRIVDSTRFVGFMNQTNIEARAYAYEFFTDGSITNCGADQINMRIQKMAGPTVNPGYFGPSHPNGLGSYNICCNANLIVLRDNYISRATTAGNVTYDVPDGDGNTVVPNDCYGYAIFSFGDQTGVVIDHNQAAYINGGLGQDDVSMKSRGVGFADGDGVISTTEFDSCTALDCIGNETSVCFDIRSNSTLQKCIASESITTRNNGELSSGYVVSNSIAPNLLKECVAKNLTLDGFRLQETATKTKVLENVALGNGRDGFSVAGTHITLEKNEANYNGNYGYLVTGSSDVISNNDATQNTVGGFKDASVGGAKANGNFYTRNKATDNGSCETWKCNYNIDYVKPKDSNILQVLSLDHLHFPKCCHPEANVSLSKKGIDDHCHKKRHH
jgi:hypothetical protein